MSTGITFGDDELAHFGVKGMKWGVHRMQAKVAGGRAARSQIKGHDAILTRTRNSAAKKTRKLNSKWKGTEHEAAYEKARQSELRRQMRWAGKGVEVSKQTGDAKTKAIAKKEEKHPHRWVVRNTAARAAALTLVVAGPIAYRTAKQKIATSNNLKIRNMYNKYAKTGIYDIKL